MRLRLREANALRSDKGFSAPLVELAGHLGNLVFDPQNTGIGELLAFPSLPADQLVASFFPFPVCPR